MNNYEISQKLKVERFIDSVRKFEIPKYPPFRRSETANFKSSAEYFNYRAECTSRGMWAIVDLESAKTIAQHMGYGKCLEIMAGRGWMASALEMVGIKVTATDDESWTNKRHKNTKPLHEIIKIGAVEAVKQFKDTHDVLLISWPPMNKICYEAIKAWGEKKPIVYMGEWMGGCTACDTFFCHYKAKKIDSIVSWPCIYDNAYIGFYSRWRLNA